MLRNVIFKRQFSNSIKDKAQSEFKSFFRLRLQDKPIKLISKVKETYKTNKTIRRTITFFKYSFAFGFLFFICPGTLVPGQYYAKMLLIQARYNFILKTQRNEDFVALIDFYNKKFNYMRKNGMLSPEVLAQDLNEMCKMIDKYSLTDDESNKIIYETLSYINQSFLPVLLKYSISFFQNTILQNAILNYLDVIAIRFDPEDKDIQEIKVKDNEEFLYREAMISQFVNLSLVILKFNQESKFHINVYQVFEDILNKAGSYYDVAETFTTMEGIQILLTDLNNDENQDLRHKSLHILRILIEKDSLVGVKLFKLKLLSNLLIHTLQDDPQTKDEVKSITEAFLSNKYRASLITQSQDFKEEKKRLTAIANKQDEYKDLKIDNSLRDLLKKALIAD